MKLYSQEFVNVFSRGIQFCSYIVNTATYTYAHFANPVNLTVPFRQI